LRPDVAVIHERAAFRSPVLPTDVPDRITLTRFSLDVDGTYRCVQQANELLTIDEPWKITLDLPAWTRKRDRRLRAAAQRRDR
jgi:hypothetical protein